MENRSSLIRRIIWLVALMSPFGYLVRITTIPDQIKEKGVAFNNLLGEVGRQDKVRFLVKPTLLYRISWFLWAIFLIGEGFYFLRPWTLNWAENDFIGAFAMFSIIYGFCLLAIALFPNINFNKKLF